MIRPETGFGRLASRAATLPERRGEVPVDDAWVGVLEELSVVSADALRDSPWSDWVVRASVLLGRRVALGGDLLSDRARIGLERLLLDRLTRLGQEVVREDGVAIGDPIRLFDRYPMLARFSATLVGQWIEATAEFVDRVSADREAVARDLGAGPPTGPIVEIDPGLSDRHGGGRTVHRVRFASGHSVFYKPRRVGLEMRFHELLGWVRAQGFDSVPTPLAGLDRSSHGWFEDAAASPTAPPADERTLYRRGGGLLSILHLLGARDCHAQNVVRRRSDPILVDGESVLHPTRDPVGGDPWGRPTEILATGLTPYWRAGHAGGSAAGGIGLAADAALVDALLDGYRETHAFLVRRRNDLQRGDGPLAPFRAERVRVLLRDTETYQNRLRRSIRPENLVDGVAWSRAADDAESLGGGSFERRVLASEHAALARLDVPRFTTRADSIDLDLDAGGTLPGFFAESGFETLASRAATIGLEGLDERLGLVRAAYALAALEGELAGGAPSPPRPRAR